MRKRRYPERFDVTHGFSASVLRRTCIWPSVTNYLDFCSQGDHRQVAGGDAGDVEASAPGLLSPSTPEFSRPEPGRTASIARIRLRSLLSPLHVETAQTTLVTAGAMVLTTSAFPYSSQAAQDRTRVCSAHSAVIPSAVQPSITTISPSSRTRRSGSGPAEPSAWACNSEPSSSTYSTL